MSVSVDAIDDIPCNCFRAHQHGIVEGATEQGCIYKSWTNIGKVDVQTSLMGLLLQSLKIGGLQGFGGRVGWGRAKSFGAGNGGDGSNMAFTFFRKVTVGRTNHSGKADCIGIHRLQFNVWLQGTVLLADA